MTQHMKSPTAGGAVGLENASLPGGIDCHSNAQEIAPLQGKNCGSARLRLVAPTPPPPRPRRFIEVRISAVDARAPYGRSRPIRLSRDDLDALIDGALRLEQRA